MLRLLLLLALLHPWMAEIAQADENPPTFQNGNTLYGFLSNRDENLAAQGKAYVAGIVDHDVYLRANRLMQGEPCFDVPNEAVGNQVADVVKNFLRDHPEHRHFGAAGLVIRSLQIAFPCTKR